MNTSWHAHHVACHLRRSYLYVASQSFLRYHSLLRFDDLLLSGSSTGTLEGRLVRRQRVARNNTCLATTQTPADSIFCSLSSSCPSPFFQQLVFLRKTSGAPSADVSPTSPAPYSRALKSHWPPRAPSSCQTFRASSLSVISILEVIRSPSAMLVSNPRRRPWRLRPART